VATRIETKLPHDFFCPLETLKEPPKRGHQVKHRHCKQVRRFGGLATSLAFSADGKRLPSR
jgi:hypothetical protein